jgi:hypothetical protein
LGSSPRLSSRIDQSGDSQVWNGYASKLSSIGDFHDDVDRGAEWCRRAAVAIAKQRALERFKWATVLQRQARGHGSVTRVGVAVRAGFVVLQENLADRAVGISADSGRVAKTTDLELESLGGASIRQALALRDSGGVAHLADLLNGGPRAGLLLVVKNVI